MHDIRLEENFKLFLSGPSRCGKTYFISTLLENISSFAKQPPTKIIYIYTVWQTKFDEMQGMVNVFIKDNSNILEQIKTYATGKPMFIIFDDMINSNSLYCSVIYSGWETYEFVRGFSNTTNVC